MVFLDYYNRLTPLYLLCVTGQDQTLLSEMKVIGNSVTNNGNGVGVNGNNLHTVIGNIQQTQSTSGKPDEVRKLLPLSVTSWKSHFEATANYYDAKIVHCQ
ncbi:hypothetical protein ANRL3_02142 [Anaerolineae bacterium]|nr:hypothetical protein ANRL3_02142 [Anaerolineae bacterium]